ncbi:MAG: response regulator [Alphaproteobacteria bacterium]
MAPPKGGDKRFCAAAAGLGTLTVVVLLAVSGWPAALLGGAGLAGFAALCVAWRRATERRLAAMAMDLTRFQRFFEGTPNGIALLDGERRVAAANAAFRSLLSASAPLGRPIGDFAEPGQRAALEDRLAAASEGAVAVLDIRVAGHPDRAISIRCAPLDGDMPGALMLHLSDATERRRLEQQFAQSQKMQAVGQLAGGIAHDFNNLLTAMIGFCDLLLQRYGPGDQSFADIMQIKQNANRGARLVRQLLAFSRQQTLQSRVLVLTDVLAELSDLLRRLLGESIALEMVHGRDLGVVWADQGQIEQVIINLAVNARDAMPQGGRLAIATANHRQPQPEMRQGAMLPAGDYVRVTVTDTGTGIRPEHLEHLFEPFFTTKEVGSGTGLGLATVYGIVKQTGGFVFVDSAGPGQGARFDIFLPRYTGAAAEPAGGEGEGAADLTGGGSILLVEDEDAVRLFCARALRGKGYIVTETRNGEAALALLAQERFDLLVTDMVMPAVDGATVIRAARDRMPDLPVICISGYTQDSVAKEVEAMPDLHFLAKPFSLQQLAAKVKEAMG